jgi:predicted nucleotidyltransferase component of viral defense system
MNDAVERMLERYECRRVEDYVRALREILQEIALFGLWRSRFYENAAFYRGTALRILYGLDRFSEDLDFTLIDQNPDFDFGRHIDALKKEIGSFGFDADVSKKKKKEDGQVQSAFLKVDSLKHLLVIEAPREIAGRIPKGQVIKIKMEVDTLPPPGFETENKYVLNPVPFSVRTVVLPDLFAGKMHAVLCRQWKTRVKGRDWYDLIWYCANHPELHLAHLTQRMIQSGHLNEGDVLDKNKFVALYLNAVEQLDVGQAKAEVEPFISNPEMLTVWSKELFKDIVTRIQFT